MTRVVTARDPGPREVILYKDSHFSGETRTFTLPGSSKEGYLFRLNEYGFKHEMSSFKLGEDIWVVFCSDEPHQDCSHGDGFKAIGPEWIDKVPHFNDWTKHMRLFPYDKNTKPAVVVYKDVDCRGYSGIFFPGRHSMRDLQWNHIGNDNADSVRVPIGLRLWLYMHEGWTKPVSSSRENKHAGGYIDGEEDS